MKFDEEIEVLDLEEDIETLDIEIMPSKKEKIEKKIEKQEKKEI